MRQLEKVVTLHVVDSKWKDHLYAMDRMREGIGLRAYGQIEPLQAYKKEGYDMFQEMINRIKEDVARYIFRVQVATDKPASPQPGYQPVGIGAGERSQLAANLPSARRRAQSGNSPSPSYGRGVPLRTQRKIGRNDPCPCGSGKKYKKCCGR
jgi:preprotein translocase subunit SecA